MSFLMFCNGRADTLQAFTIIVLTSVGRLLTRTWSGGVFSHTQLYIDRLYQQIPPRLSTVEKYTVPVCSLMVSTP